MQKPEERYKKVENACMSIVLYVHVIHPLKISEITAFSRVPVLQHHRRDSYLVYSRKKIEWKTDEEGKEWSVAVEDKRTNGCSCLGNKDLYYGKRCACTGTDRSIEQSIDLMLRRKEASTDRSNPSSMTSC